MLRKLGGASICENFEDGTGQKSGQIFENIVKFYEDEI